MGRWCLNMISMLLLCSNEMNEEKEERRQKKKGEEISGGGGLFSFFTWSPQRETYPVGANYCAGAGYLLGRFWPGSATHQHGLCSASGILLSADVNNLPDSILKMWPRDDQVTLGSFMTHGMVYDFEDIDWWLGHQPGPWYFCPHWCLQVVIQIHICENLSVDILDD